MKIENDFTKAFFLFGKCGIIKLMSNKFYLTTPIYYANNIPHSGSAYTTIAADVLARYHRLKGEKVFFLVGTDEHGGKIEETAQEAGKTPRQLCDENAEIFKKTWRSLNISYDNFIRTTDPKHKEAVKKILQILWEKGLIYKGDYEGLYCLGCEQYKTRDELVEGKCSLHQKKPVLLKEESYFFKLSLFEDRLRKAITTDLFEIKPVERKNEVLNFLDQGLQDISISRQKVKWGVPLPFDQKFTAYVWVDAFFNYLTGLGWQGDPKNLPEFWPANLHLMAKDILRVHTTIWPALLLALDIPLPKKIFAHGFLTLNNQKMSKSLGNVIWPEEMIEKFGIDASRYLILSVAPFGQDGDISWQKLIEKYNADLANGLGNLVARVLAMAEKYESGIRNQESKIKNQKSGIKNQEITRFSLLITDYKTRYEKAFANLQLYEALKIILQFISHLDKYIDQEKPWILAKKRALKGAATSEPSLSASPGALAPGSGNSGSSAPGSGFDKLEEVLYNLIQGLNEIASFIQPFMPETAERIREGLEGKTMEKKVLFPRISRLSS